MDISGTRFQLGRLVRQQAELRHVARAVSPWLKVPQLSCSELKQELVVNSRAKRNPRITTLARYFLATKLFSSPTHKVVP